MSALRWAGWLIVLGAATIGCSKLNAGRCDVTSDCMNPLTEHCDTGTKKCFPNTDGGAAGTGGMGGAGAAAGSHGGAGGAKVTFTCPNSLCKADGSTPICDVDAGTCRGCNVESTAACQSLGAGTNACVSAADAGASLGMCVVCVSNKDCSGAKPVCDTTSNTCVGCLANSDCAGTASSPSTTPICEFIGTSTTPIDTCRACSADAECGGPGVCMADGHCAMTSEVIFVQFSASGCLSSDGSAAKPYCAPNDAVAQLTALRHVIVIVGNANNQMTLGTMGILPVVIGRKSSSGVVGSVPATAATAVAISSDTVLIRDLTVNLGSSGSVGIALTGNSIVTLLRVTASTGMGLGIGAAAGTTLTMQGCTVSGNSGGGILLNGSAFDVEETTVTNNGPGQDAMGNTWGGIRVISPPAGGPAVLKLVTVQNNNPVGVSCTAGISGTDVLASGSTSGIDITTSCNVSTCADAGPVCGAQP